MAMRNTSRKSPKPKFEIYWFAYDDTYDDAKCTCGRCWDANAGWLECLKTFRTIDAAVSYLEKHYQVISMGFNNLAHTEATVEVKQGQTCAGFFEIAPQY